MIVVYLIFLAVIQAVTEFLPVSSLGHLCILEQYMGIGHETELLSETMLHLGSAAAIIFLFRKDLKKIGLGLLGMFMDMIGNLNLYIHNKKTGESLGYARIVTGTSRQLCRESINVLYFTPASSNVVLSTLPILAIISSV